jgi:hypothetical protein
LNIFKVVFKILCKIVYSKSEVKYTTEAKEEDGIGLMSHIAPILEVVFWSKVRRQKQRFLIKGDAYSAA